MDFLKIWIFLDLFDVERDFDDRFDGPWDFMRSFLENRLKHYNGLHALSIFDVKFTDFGG